MRKETIIIFENKKYKTLNFNNNYLISEYGDVYSKKSKANNKAVN